MKQRCKWVSNDPVYIDYHDCEWGRPIYSSRLLFELLCLEGMQAGLSWITVLKKRDNYRLLFDQFDPYKISNYSVEKLTELVVNPGIIRHRLKVEAIVINARQYLALQHSDVDFSEYLWGFVGGSPLVNCWQDAAQVPAATPESEAMSSGLKQLGFKFVGPTICYAFMQAAGMVNDHTRQCYLYHGAK